MHTIPTDTNQLGSYFGSLHKGSIKPNIINAIPGFKEDVDLDKQITEEEFTKILKGLITNKAPGYDEILAIVFKSFLDQLVTFTTQLFNNILTQENFPASWSIGKFKPFYKKDGPSNPKNYKGITLFPIIGKLFIQILSNRITSWVEKHNILCEAHYSFCKGRRTINPIFILTQILDGNKKNKPVFSCFVDLAIRLLIVSTSNCCGLNSHMLA